MLNKLKTAFDNYMVGYRERGEQIKASNEKALLEHKVMKGLKTEYNSIMSRANCAENIGNKDRARELKKEADNIKDKANYISARYSVHTRVDAASLITLIRDEKARRLEAANKVWETSGLAEECGKVIDLALKNGWVGVEGWKMFYISQASITHEDWIKLVVNFPMFEYEKAVRDNLGSNPHLLLTEEEMQQHIISFKRTLTKARNNFAVINNTPNSPK